MKTRITSKIRSNSAYALIIVLVLGAIALVTVTATMSRTGNTTQLNNRNDKYVSGMYAAEAATEKVLARMRWDFSQGGETSVTNNVAVYRGQVPTVSETPIWSEFEFSDAQGHVGTTYVGAISNRVYSPLQSQYSGLSGWRTVYRVVSNVRRPGSPLNITNAIGQDVELDTIPVFQFAIFYNSLLEFTWAAPLVVRGRTHSNGNIFVGSSSDLNFYAVVTASGILVKTNWDGHTLSQYTGNLTFATNNNGGYSTNVPSLQLPIGTNNTPAAVREIIRMPPAGEDPTSPLGSQRFYNKAAVDLLVSNSIVTAVLKTSATDPSPTTLTSATNTAALLTNFPFLSITNTFTDQRENDTIKATQIDMAKLSAWLQTNTSVTAKFAAAWGVYPNILYVADNRTTSSGQFTAVRLVNGTTIPANPTASGQPTGLTVATPNPLYVKGHYNCPNSAALGTTNTSATYPAALISDALTILSPNWNDSQSASSFTSRTAVSTTINAAILTGIVYSTASDANSFSGGVMNLPRLLEDWGNGSPSVVLTLNTSIVNLFNSLVATNQFKNPGTYYYAPSRQINFDQNFTNPGKLPPGTPELAVMLRARWVVLPPGTIN